jgi:glycogen operon protein
MHGWVQCEKGIKDITWLAPEGGEMNEGHWSDPERRSVGLLLNGRADGRLGELPLDEILLLLLNAHPEDIDFHLPALPFGSGWVELLAPARRPESTLHEFDSTFRFAGRSVVLFHLAVEV